MEVLGPPLGGGGGDGGGDRGEDEGCWRLGTIQPLWNVFSLLPLGNHLLHTEHTLYKRLIWRVKKMRDKMVEAGT